MEIHEIQALNNILQQLHSIKFNLNHQIDKVNSLLMSTNLKAENIFVPTLGWVSKNFLGCPVYKEWASRNRIASIKFIRDQTGMSLLDAKILHDKTFPQ